MRILALPAALYVAFIGLPLVTLLLRTLLGTSFLGGMTSDVALIALRLSLATSAVAMLVVVIVGTPLAYLLARGGGGTLTMIDGLVELPIVLPPVVAGIAMLMAFGRTGVLGSLLENAGIALPFTTVAVVLAQLFVAAPFYVRSARLGFASVPREYEELSYTLGLTPWRTFLRITLPLAWPSLLSGLGLAWARALSEFGATIMFAGNLPGETQTMPLAIFTAIETNVDATLAMAVLLTFASLVILMALLLLRYVQERRST